MNYKQSEQLLYESLSRLSPDAFSHPIWVDFITTNASFSPKLVEDLLSVAQQLQTMDDLVTACQIRLICAVMQNRLGDHAAALNSTEQSWVLAELHKLPQIAEWAIWGSGALCAKQGDYERAAQYLNRLHVRLSEVNEWVLDNIVQFIRQTLLNLAYMSATQGDESSLSLPAGSKYSITLDWLLRWGDPPLTIAAEQNYPDGNDRDDGNSLVRALSSPFSARVWHSLWRTLKRVAKGELRLAWVERKDPSVPPPIPSGQLLERSPAAVPSFPLVDALPPAPTAHSQVIPPGSDLSSLPSGLPLSPPTALSNQATTGPSLTVYCLGSFRVYQDDEPVEDWPNGKGKLIFKYLVTHREYAVPKEVLMEFFWPDAKPDAARNNLNVVIYTLRQILRKSHPKFAHILFQDDCYLFNPDLQMWVDYEAFIEHFKVAQKVAKRGKMILAIREYRAAEALYQGELLAEDRYEEWLLPQRQRLQADYLDLLDRLSCYYRDQGDYDTCARICDKMLVVDSCWEEAYRRLMYCYSRQGQPYLALHQYHLCVEALQKELDMPPMNETLTLYQQILAGEAL